MHETGNPLHAFDLNKVAGEIHIRKANKGEKIIVVHNLKDSNAYLKQLLHSSNIESFALPNDFFYLSTLPTLGNGKKDYFHKSLEIET